MNETNLKLPFTPRTIAVVLFVCVILLVLASLCGQFYKEAAADSETLLKVIRKFDLDYERNNVPTWYQSATLLLSSFLLALTALVRRSSAALQERREARWWGFLAAIFLYLSLDEAVAIHEQLTMPLRTTFDLGGVFYLSWVIPALVLLSVLLAVLGRFLLGLPARTRNLFLAAGTVYVLGAVGVEMLGGLYLDATGDLPTRVFDPRYVLITTFEEFLEMTGIVIFIYSLLTVLFGRGEARVPAETVLEETSSASPGMPEPRPEIALRIGDGQGIWH